MKIGILTYHRVVNDGSIMQAFCLARIINSLAESHHVEIIDYRPRLVETREIFKTFSRRWPFYLADERAKRKNLRAFLNRRVTFSPDRLTSDNLIRAKKYVEQQNYDSIVVGSDTAWEVRPNGGAPLAPNIYSLPGIVIPRKLAFAVSADQSLSSFYNEPARRDRLLEYYSDFDFISVRDENTKEVLRAIGVDSSVVSYMPDPTLFWDFSSEVDITSLGVAGKLAGVMVGYTDVRQQATDFFRKQGYTVINLLGEAVPGQLQLPRQFNLAQKLGIFAQLDTMLTDRFHGTIFTLKLSDAPVLFIERQSKYPEPNSKGRDLLRRLGLEHMVMRIGTEGVSPGKLKELLEGWSTEKVNSKERIANLVNSATPALEEFQAILLG